MRARPLLLVAVLLGASPVSAQTLDQRVDQILSIANTISQRTQTLLTRTAAIRDDTLYLGQTVRAGVDAISPEMSEQMRGGLVDLKDRLQRDRVGLAAFLGVDEVAPPDTSWDFSPPAGRELECLSPSPCFSFRAELDAMIVQLGELASSLKGDDLDPAITLELSFDRARLVIDEIPHRALYPLYQIMVVEQDLFEGGLPILLTRAREAAEELRAAENDEQERVAALDEGEPGEPTDDPDFTRSAFPRRQFEANGCVYRIEYAKPLNTVRMIMTPIAPLLKFLGAKMKGVSEMGFDMPDMSGGAAAGANVHITIETKPAGGFGTFLERIGTTIEAKIVKLTAQLNSCAVLQAQLDILDNQELIVARLAEQAATQATILARIEEQTTAQTTFHETFEAAVQHCDNDEVLFAVEKAHAGRPPARGCSSAPSSALAGLSLLAGLLLVRRRRRT